MYIKSLDHSDTNGNPKVKYNWAVLISHGREPDAEKDKLFTLAFLLAGGKDVGPNTRSIKYPHPTP